MLKSIIKKEILQNLTSYKFTIIVILSIVLILVSMFIMYRDYQLRLENYEILQPKSNEPIAIIPPSPLSIFAKGLDENLTRSYEIRFGGQIRVGSKQQSVNNLFRLFTTPDLLYVIKVILALCAMLFAFDMVCGEKESGTLKLTLSNRLNRPMIILGKWIGGFASFIVPFLLATLVGTIFILFSPQIQFSGEGWLKLGMFLFSSVIYLAIFFSLGLLISSLTNRTSSSLVISLFAWAMLVFVVPNLGNILARQFIKIQSVQQLEVRRQQFWIKEVFEAINKGKSWEQAQAAISSENDKLISDYRTRFNQLVTLSQNITRFSPAAAFTYLTTDIAGTGIYEERRLKQVVVEYKNQIWDKPTDSDGNIVGEFPSFSYERTSIAQVLDFSGMSNLLVLILFNVLFFTAAYVVFLRYDVR
jgi:ABC-type transport system involved in multi-copper enzyme maturation permease subunit